MYIVIEVFDKSYPMIVLDAEGGKPLIFEDEKQAEEEAKGCQQGIVVEY